MNPTRLIATSVLVAVIPLASALPAHAGDQEEIRRGSCTGSTDWKIKASPDNGGIEVEAEIDSNVNGQTWRWVLRHDGDVVDRGRKETQAPSGSFEVRRHTDDNAGTDGFKFRAVNPGTDEVCVARVRL